MPPKTLIAYATRYGSTAEVAAQIGEVLAGSGAAVEVAAMPDAPPPEGCDAAILGSPIHGGQWLPEALTYINQHRAALQAMPVALFMLCMLVHDTPENQQAKALAAREISAVLKPVAVAVFGGVMAYADLSAIARLQVQSKGLPEGDFRNWDAVQQWAQEAVRALAE